MSASQPHLPSSNDEPAWEAAYLLPPQGRWCEEDFLKLHTNRMAELVAGRLEILPMPNPLHQLIVIFLLDRLRKHLRESQTGGRVFVAPLPARLFPGTIREPDVLYLKPENVPADLRDYPAKLDMAIEVVSEGTDARRRDYVDKRADYAKAEVAEYWIVDPQDKRVTVLSLRDGQYDVVSECHPGDVAESVLMPGLSIATDEIWSLADKAQ